MSSRRTASGKRSWKLWVDSPLLAITSIIGALATIISLLISLFSLGTLNPQPSSYAYVVKVSDSDSLSAIPGAKVTVQVKDTPLFTSVTDSNGITRFSIPIELLNQAARITVEATGYNTYELNVALRQNGLPDTILLTRT